MADDLTLQERLAIKQAFDKAQSSVAKVAGQSKTSGPIDPMAVDRRASAPAGYRSMTDTERLFKSIGDIGDSIMDWAGYDASTFGNGRFDVDQVVPFLKSLPAGMASAPFSAIEKAYESITGNPTQEATDDGWIPDDYKLDTEQRIGNAIDAAIDVFGLGLGATGKVLKAGKWALTGAKQTASKAVAGAIEKQAGKSAGSIVGDLLGGAAEEGAEEFAQSILEDIRGTKEGHAHFDENQDWDKALKSAALGAIGGGIMHGAIRGGAALIDATDKAIKKASQPFSTTIDPSLGWDPSNPDALLEPYTQEWEKQLNEASQFAASTYGKGVVSNNTKINEIELGSKSWTQMIIREGLEIQDPNKRLLTQRLNNYLVANPALSQAFGTNDITEIAKRVEASDDNNIWSAWENVINTWLQTIDGYDAVIYKNPGGPMGAIRVKIVGCSGRARRVSLHGILSMLLMSDYDSDMYSVIGYEAWTSNSANGNAMDYATSLMSMVGGKAWTKDMFHAIGASAVDLDGIIDSVKNLYPRSLMTNTLEETTLIDSKDMWDSYVETVLRNEFSQTVKPDDATMYQIGNAPIDRLRNIYSLNPGLVSLVQIIYRNIDRSQNVDDVLSAAFSAGSSQQSLIARTEADAIAANKANSNMVQNKVKEQQQTIRQQSRGLAYGVRGNLEAIARHYQNIIFDPAHSYCRENLSLYYGVEDIIDALSYTLEQGNDPNFESTLERLMLKTMRLKGPGLHPAETSIILLRATIAAEVEAEYADATCFTEEQYNNFKDIFKETYNKYQKWFVDQYASAHEGSDYGADLIMPVCEDTNIDQIIFRCFSQKSITFFMDGTSSGNKVFSSIETLASTVVNNVIVDLSDDSNNIEKHVEQYLRDSGYSINRSSVKVLTSLVKGYARLRSSDSRAYSSFIEKLIGLQYSSNTVAVINRILQQKKDNNGIIKFSGAQGLTDLAVMKNFFQTLYVSLGDKRFFNVGWASIGRIFSGNQQVTNWNGDVNSQVSIIGKIRDAFITTDTKQLLNACVSMAAYCNTFGVREQLYNIKRAAVSDNMTTPQRTDAINKAALKLRAEIYKLQGISPLYHALVDRTMIGPDLLFMDGKLQQLTMEQYAERATEAISIIEKLVDPDVEFNGKQNTYAYINLGYKANLGYETDAYNMFISDALASPQDMDDITTLSSNLRKAEKYKKQIEINSWEYCQQQINKFQTSISEIGDRDKVFNVLQSQQEALVYDLNLDIYASPLFDIDWQPTADAVKKTEARAAFQAAWEAQTIQKAGRVVSDFDNIWDDRLGVIQDTDLFDTPTLMSRLLLTDFIDERGGIWISWKGKVEFYASRIEFLEKLSGIHVETAQTIELRDLNDPSGNTMMTIRRPSWSTPTLLETLFAKYPTIINSIMPTYNSFRSTDTGGVTTFATTTSPEIDQMSFTEAVSNYDKQTADDQILKRMWINRLMRKPEGVSVVLSVVANLNKNMKFENIRDARYQLGQAADILWQYTKKIFSDTNGNSNEINNKIFGESAVFENIIQQIRQITIDSSRSISESMARNVDEDINVRLEDILKNSAETEKTTAMYQWMIMQVINSSAQYQGSFAGSVKAQLKVNLEKVVRDYIKAESSAGIQESILLAKLAKFARTGLKPDITTNLRGHWENWFRTQIESVVLNPSDRQAIRDLITDTFLDDTASGLVLKAEISVLDTFQSIIDSLARYVKAGGVLKLSQNRIEDLAKIAIDLGNGSTISFRNQYSSLIDWRKGLAGIEQFTKQIDELGKTYKAEVDKAIANKPNDELEQARKLFSVILFDTIQDISDVSRNDMNLGSISYLHSNFHDAIAEGFDFLRRSEEDLGRLYKTPTGPVPDISIDQISPVNIEIISRYIDELNRGNSQVGVSNIASERYMSASSFVDYPMKINERQQDWTSVQDRTADEICASLQNFAASLSPVGVSLDRILRDNVCSGLYKDQNNNTRVITNAMLWDWINNPATRPQGTFKFCGAWEQNAGFDSRFFGANATGAAHYNPFQVVLDKLVLNGAESKQLKTAKKLKMFLEMNFSNADPKFVRKLRSLLTIDYANATIQDVVDNVEKAKSLYIQELWKTYEQLGRELKKADGELDLTLLDMKMIADHAFQFVTIELEAANDTDLCRVPIPYFQLVKAQNKALPIAQLTNCRTNQQYEVTMPDGTTTTTLSSLLQQRRAKEIKIVPSSVTTLNEVFRRVQYKHVMQNNNGKLVLGNDAEWQNAFIDCVQTGMQDGRDLYKYCFATKQEHFDAVQKAMTNIRYNINPVESNIAAQVRMGSIQSVAESTTPYINTKQAMDELSARRSNKHTKLDNLDIVLAYCLNPRSPFEAVSPSDKIKGPVFEKDDAILIGSNQTDQRSLEDVIGFCKRWGGNQKGQIKTILIDTTNTKAISELTRRGIIGTTPERTIKDGDIQYQRYRINGTSRDQRTSVTSDLVFESPENYIYCLFTDEVPGDGMYHINDISTPGLRKLGENNTINVSLPKATNKGRVTVDQAPLDALNSISNNPDGLLDVSSWPRSEQPYIRQAFEDFRNASANMQWSEGMCTRFPSSTGSYQCIGLYKVENRPNSNTYTWQPIIVKTKSNSYMTGAPTVNVSDGSPIVGWQWKWDDKSYGDLIGTIKLFFKDSGLKGMGRVLDTQVYGQWDIDGITYICLWNDNYNSGKYDAGTQHARNCYRHMRVESNRPNNKMLSLFFKDKGQHSVEFNDDIYDPNSPTAWDDSKKAALVGSPHSKEFAEVVRLVQEGQLKFHHADSLADSCFNDAMKKILVNVQECGSYDITLANILSGKNIFIDENGEYKYRDQAPSEIDTAIVFDGISTEELNALFSAINPEFWPSNRSITGKLFDWNGLMKANSTSQNIADDQYYKVVIEAKAINNGVNVDADVSTLPAHASNKILFTTALSQGTFNGTDYSPLRAESLRYLDESVVPDVATRETLQYVRSRSDSTEIKQAHQLPDGFYTTQIANMFEQKSAEERDRLSMNSYMDRGRFNTILAERNYLPPIEARDGKTLYWTVDDMLKDEEIRAAFESYKSLFRDDARFTNDILFQIIVSVLGYSYNSGKGNPRLYAVDVRDAINRSADALKTKGLLVDGESIARASGDEKFSNPIVPEFVIDFYLDNYKGSNKKQSRSDYHTAIKQEVKITLDKASKSNDLAKNRAIINMIEAYKSQSDELSDIDTGIVFGTTNIADIATNAEAISKFVAGKNFAVWSDFNQEQMQRIEQTRRRREAYNDRSKRKPRTGKRGWIKSVTPKYKTDFIDQFSGDVLTGLAALSRAQALMLPELPFSSVGERFWFGGQGNAMLLLGMKNNFGPYKSNLSEYFTDEELSALVQQVKTLAKSDSFRKLYENRRLIAVLADMGYTNDMVNAAGGLQAFLSTHKEQSSKFMNLYEQYVNVMTGKGFGNWIQAQNFLFDILRLVSLDPVRANALFQKQLDTQQPAIFDILREGTAEQWVMQNCFQMDGALWDVANQAFNFSLIGDTAQKTPLTIVLTEFCVQHPVLSFFNTTMLCRFPLYSINIAERFANAIFPMTSLNYVLAKFGSRTDEKGEFTGLAKLRLPGFRGLTVGQLHLEDSLIVNSLQEAIGRDLVQFGTMGVATLLFALSGAVEPPPDEDKWGNIDEWLFFGNRIAPKWWIKDLLGPALGYAAMWKSFALGKPRTDILFSSIQDAFWSNPVFRAADVVECLFNPYKEYMDSYYRDVERFDSASDGVPDPIEVLWGNMGLFTANWAAQFLTPGIIKEWYKASNGYEVSYKKVAKTDARGDVIKGSDGNPIYVSADYYDQKIRLAARDNPIIAVIADMLTGSGFAGEKTGYLRSEMPRTVYYDPTQLDCYQALSLYTTDQYGNVIEKSDYEQQAIALGVIVKLQANADNLEELYEEGFCLPYETMKYVSDVIWDIAYEKTRMYEDMLKTGQLDYYVLGNGDAALGKELADIIYKSYQEDTYYWKDFYYNVLWSEQMRRGIQKYNRYNTYYEQDDNGNWYATGYRRGNILSALTGFEVAPQSGTMGYYGDWGSPSAVTGENMWERALVPIEELPDVPKWESLGNSANGGYSNSYGKYSKSYGGGGSYRGNSTPPRIYTPSVGSGYRLQSPNTSAAKGYGRPISNVDLNSYYIRPGFETKGSRKAYKREDI